MLSVSAQAVRSWKSAKGIAAFATLAFAVGTGSTTAVFALVNAVLLKQLPYAEGDRVVALFGGTATNPSSRSSISLRDVAEYQRRTTSFDVFGWFRLASFNLTAPGQPQHVKGTAVTPSLAHHLGVNPMMGRWFTDETGAVLSHALWRRLGASPNIVGQGLTLNGRRFTVTGVMPRGFLLPVVGPGTEGFQSEVWVYLDPSGRGEEEGRSAYFAYARRKPGVTLAEAVRDVERAAAEIVKLNPAPNSSYTARLDDLHTATIKQVRPTLLLLFGAAGLLLLITCANVATLLVARSVARTRETAIRVALGAPQGRLALFYLAEAMVVSVAGAAAGVLLSLALVRGAAAIAAQYVPASIEMGLEFRVLLFALGAAFLASTLSSMAPLWQALRTAPNDVLTDGVRASAGARARRLSQGLVIAEVALAFALLAASAVLIAHLRGLSRVATGFDYNNLLVFELTMPEEVIRSTARVSYQRRLIEALEAIPGVSGAALASGIPLDGCCFGGAVYPEGRAAAAPDTQRNSFVFVSPGYFRTLSIPLRSGRVLEESDADSAERLLRIVANQAAVAQYWPDRNPIGASGRFNVPDGDRFEIIGVAGDVRNDGLSRPTVPEFYLPSLVVPFNPMQFVVRSPRPTEQLISEVRRAIQRVDPTLPIHEPGTMHAIVRDSLVLERTSSFVMAFFAIAALLMATLGIYGVASYSVRQRTVEIGTRMALGAAGRDVLTLVVGGGLKMAAYGVGAGAVAVIASTWLLVRFFQIRDIGLFPFVWPTMLVAGVAAIASLVPAWRATLVSPLVAIRNEPGAAWSPAHQRLRQALAALWPAGSGRPGGLVVSPGTLLTEFVASARQAESFPAALQMSLATLCKRFGAKSAVLFEKASGEAYRCVASAWQAETVDYSLPAQGFLLNRLRSYPYPLAFSSGEFDTVLLWAREHAPRHIPEVLNLKKSDVRIAVPLQTKHEILGVLVIGPPSGRDGYDAAERQLLQNCAEQFALMIENARLTARVVEQEMLRRDVALAAEVQKRLLPERPPEAGIAALAAVSLPARSVGGDYYDFIDVGDHRIGIALADVSGKGIAAALIMSVVQASLRIISSEGNVSLPRVVEKMNRFLLRSTAANSYATFFYAQIDESTRQLRYVNAGHNPPYLLRPAAQESSMHELSTGGAVIGLFPHMSYSEATVDLQSGDLLVAFTDGVTEALNATDEEFGEQRLKDLLWEVVHLPVHDIASRIAEELRNWIRDAAQYDDLTFIIMKVK